MFATFKEADKECRKREQADPENLYFCHMTSAYVDEIPQNYSRNSRNADGDSIHKNRANFNDININNRFTHEEN